MKGHKSSFDKCPAKGKTCNKCGKNDHFARKCMTREPVKRKQATEETKDEPNTKIKRDMVQLLDSTEPKLDDYEDVFMLQTKQEGNKIWCKVGGIEVQAVVDSGSKFNVVDRETWCDLKARNIPTLKKTKDVDIGFRAYEGYQLKFLGMFEATIQVADKQIVGKFYVADETGKLLIGWESATALKILKIDYEVNNLEAGQTPVEPFSKIRNVLVEIPIKDNVKAVQQPYRRIPAPLEKAVDAKIEELLSKDIIEKVDSSNWISPLVVVPKPDKPGEIRVCVDMKRANEAVARENHPLPIMEDFLPELGSAEWFSKIDVAQAFHQVDIENN